MMFQNLLLILLLFGGTCFGQVNEELTFKRKGKKRKITLVLPAQCNVITKDGSRLHRVNLYGRNDSTLFFLRHSPDTAVVDAIWRNDSISRKEKKALIDSVYKADTVTVAINISDLQKISFGAFNTKQHWHKVRSIFLGVTFLAAGGLFLYTIINSAGNPRVQDYFAVAAYPASFALWMTFARFRLKADKWEIK